MEKFYIVGGNQLNGKLKIKGAKNAILPILAGTILCKDKVTIKNVPNLSDIHNMCEILRILGCEVTEKQGEIIVNSKNINSYILPSELTNKLRASIFLLGPLLALQKRARVSFPGGCNIGNRPIDIHLDGLKNLGVDIIENHGFINCDATSQQAREYTLRFPSVGATENLIMSAVFTKGITTLNNCAKEPEIVDLQNFLNKMGAKISGAGTCQIVIQGVKKLHGTSYSPIGDRIVAGTYIIATLCTGGNVELSNIDPKHLSSLLEKIASNDCLITTKNDKIKIVSKGRKKSIPFVETKPYPDFPTDLQAQMMTLQAVSEGTSILVENIFESRFRHVPQLIKMGADITIKNNYAIINGKERLQGAEVTASDLRAGASLVIAGLCANGYTTISDIYHIDRGYDHIEDDLTSLGADIKRIDSE